MKDYHQQAWIKERKQETVGEFVAAAVAFVTTVVVLYLIVSLFQ